MRILSLEEYKEKLYEAGFYNPFDEDGEPKKEAGSLPDYGGYFRKRKETFNPGKIEYSKRDNGEYTVLAKTNFSRGEIVEIAPVIIVGEIVKTINKLKNLVFEINKGKDEWGIVLGYGSLYRHSSSSNLDFAYNPKRKQIHFIANKFIKVGEELTINYGDDYWKERMGFKTFSEIPEMQLQPNSYDSQETVSKVEFSKDSGNPARTGIAIKGLGQQ